MLRSIPPGARLYLNLDIVDIRTVPNQQVPVFPFNPDKDFRFVGRHRTYFVQNAKGATHAYISANREAILDLWLSKESEHIENVATTEAEATARDYADFLRQHPPGEGRQYERINIPPVFQGQTNAGDLLAPNFWTLPPRAEPTKFVVFSSD